MEHSEALIDHRYLNLHIFSTILGRVPAAFLTDGLCAIYAKNDIFGSNIKSRLSSIQNGAGRFKRDEIAVGVIHFDWRRAV